MVEATSQPVVAGSRSAPRARAGVLGIGLEAYWPQFEGLKDRITGYQQRVEARIAELGAEVVSAGLVDTAPKARTAGDLFAAVRALGAVSTSPALTTSAPSSAMRASTRC